MSLHRSQIVTAVAILLSWSVAPAPAAAPAPLPTPADVKTLTVYPTRVSLPNGDASHQMVVTGTLQNGRQVDLTRAVRYTVTDAKLAEVSATGRVTPLANGSTQLTISFGDKTASVPVTTAHIGENLPINFPNQVVPVFTKLSCNSGGCHGKASGQNGFKLSLLGFEPQFDYMTLVKESRGRRLFPSAPDQSLFLLKASGNAPHGGGKKMIPGSDEYKIVRRWIASGMPYGQDTDPVVTKVTVYPEHRILDRNSHQQFAVYAHYSDGTVEDITQRAQYESNDTEIATVNGQAYVSTLGLSGEAAIMARYQVHVAVVRITVPLGVKTPDWQFAENTLVDKFTVKKWKELGLVPSELSSDAAFIRRASLDITGTLPIPEQVAQFVADPDAKKRDKLVDRLVDSPAYADFFAGKWADILRVKRGGKPDRAAGTFAFHAWIREAIARDLPYSEFVRGILTATGDENGSPATVWYKELNNPEQFVDDMAQVFLGQRLACANCHHHPFEKWSQDDYWGLAAFFGRLGRKNIPIAGGNNARATTQIIFTTASGSVTNKRTNQPAQIKPLDDAPMTLAAEDDPRQALADWMTNPANPFFAKAVSNRYWAHFFGRGIVDPLDDMRVTNPPTNPELLDALAQSLTDHNFSLKSLVKLICKSRTYQLSAAPNEWNQHDKQAYARYYPKRMSAEVLLDAVNQITASKSAFNGLPGDAFAPARAIQLPDESFNSYFLDVFGRPARASACECERVSEANLAQALHLLNSDEVQGKVSAANGRAAMLADPKDTRTDAEKVTELFLWVFSRKPTAEDLKTALTHIEKNAANKKTAYENIVWALLNTKEFVFNQ
ncbi:MAG: DUF1553 domain-containing protein [Bacteroidales bacterium]|nr:DUF1553 domain-containing protein [Bacteroidales bacterium]